MGRGHASLLLQKLSASPPIEIDSQCRIPGTILDAHYRSHEHVVRERGGIQFRSRQSRWRDVPARHDVVDEELNLLRVRTVTETEFDWQPPPDATHSAWSL